MKDYKELEFLAGKSREMVEKQVGSYRQKHSNAGIIIGITALFVPFFLSGLEDSFLTIQLLSLIPISIILCSIILMLIVLRTKQLFQFFSVDKFHDLVNKDYEEILLYEIGANNDSFRDNKPIDEKVNTMYNLGVKLTIIAIFISLSLLLLNKFYHPDKQSIKVELVNFKAMSDTEKPRVIPTVPPSERERLNEGVDKPKNPPQPQPKPQPKPNER